MNVCVCVEGRGKAEGYQKATGAPEASPTTLQSKPVVAERTAAMETPD